MKKMYKLILSIMCFTAMLFGMNHVSAVSGCYVDNESIVKNTNSVSYKVKCDKDNYINIVEIKDSSSAYKNQVNYNKKDKISSFEQTYTVRYERLDAVIYIRISYFDSNGKEKKSEPKEIDFRTSQTATSEAGTANSSETTTSEEEFTKEIVGQNNMCSEDSTLKQFFNAIWKFIAIVTPPLLILMSSIDFFKAITSSDADKLKKASSSALTRTLAFVLLLFLRFILNTLFGFIGLEICL